MGLIVRVGPASLSGSFQGARGEADGQRRRQTEAAGSGAGGGGHRQGKAERRPKDAEGNASPLASVGSAAPPTLQVCPRQTQWGFLACGTESRTTASSHGIRGHRSRQQGQAIQMPRRLEEGGAGLRPEAGVEGDPSAYGPSDRRPRARVPRDGHTPQVQLWGQRWPRLALAKLAWASRPSCVQPGVWPVGAGVPSPGTGTGRPRSGRRPESSLALLGSLRVRPGTTAAALPSRGS